MAQALHVMNACLAQKAPAEICQQYQECAQNHFYFCFNEFSVNLIIQYLITSPL
jgi:hypothetical protein